jgi:anti-sigma B factor antagonist
MHEHIEFRTVGGVATVELAGEVDLVVAPAVRQALEHLVDRTPDRIVVTVRDVTFIDSTGLGAIVHGHRLAADRGIELSLSEPSPPVRRVLHMTGLENLVDDLGD